MSAFLGILVFLMILNIYLMRRNKQVLDLQLEYINKVSAAAKEDLRLGRPWEWRYEALESVSQLEMLLKFCVPLKKFYKDKSFLDPSATNPKTFESSIEL